MTSEELFSRCLQVAPGGVHSPVRAFKGMGRVPVFFESAQGAKITSVEGKEYIDFCQSFGPLILGHRDPDVQEEVLSMVHKAWTFGACERYSLELAEWMTTNIPWLDKVRFVSSGTEAVMSTLRVARAATGRHKILKFNGCYHGHVDSMLVKSGSGLAGEATSDSAGVSEQVAAETLVCNLDDEEMLESIFKEHGQSIAAVVIEPLPANYGLLIQRQEFLQKIQTLCQKNQSLLIFDEVISGFRVAKGGMAEMTGITPDMVCYGKIIGGGFPVGCYGGREDLMALVAPSGPVYQAGTLSGNPIGMKAGLTTLKKADANDLWTTLGEKTKSFAAGLESIFAKHNMNKKVTHHPSLLWMHGNTSEVPRHLRSIPEGHAEAFRDFFLSCLEEGIYFAPNGFEVSFLSWAHTDEILTETLERLDRALSRLKH